MHVVTNTSDTKSRTSAGYFTRTELNQILNVYARFVSSGEWRDYALDHLDGMAVFSIYRSSVEQPLFTVEKHKLKGRDRWQYQLRDRRKLIKTAGGIETILNTLKNLPKLVHNKH